MWRALPKTNHFVVYMYFTQTVGDALIWKVHNCTFQKVITSNMTLAWDIYMCQIKVWCMLFPNKWKYLIRILPRSDPFLQKLCCLIWTCKRRSKKVCSVAYQYCMVCNYATTYCECKQPLSFSHCILWIPVSLGETRCQMRVVHLCLLLVLFLHSNWSIVLQGRFWSEKIEKAILSNVMGYEQTLAQQQAHQLKKSNAVLQRL